MRMDRKQKKQAKIIPKRTTLLQKLAYILRPFVVYMLVKTFAMLCLAIAIPSLPISGITAWVEEHSSQLSAVVNGVASVIAVCFVLNDFLIEVNTTGEVDIDISVPKQLVRFFRHGFFGYPEQYDAERNEMEKKSGVRRVAELLLCIVIGIVSSLALNGLIEFVTNLMQGESLLGSERYDAVESIQYSVPVWLGLILYGIISPLVEEIVFRGIIYGRIKRFYGVPKAVIFSALLFGMFHANLPQFIYGTAMGIIIALCYECVGCFAAPVLVHMAANIFVFLLAV